MTEARLDTVSPGRYQLVGELDFASVPALVDHGRELFSGDGDVQVSLDAVERGNSAGLVLLVDWLREAHRRQRRIRFTGVPAQMLALARVSGVDELLVLEGR